MQKVGNTTDTADANGEWTNGNVAQGIPPTIINATILNTWQRELVNVVEGSGLALEPSNDTQVLTAIKNTVKNEFPNSLLTDGYQKFSSGLIIQWMNPVASGVASNGSVTLPIPFPNALLFSIVADSVTVGSPASLNLAWNINASTKSSIAWSSTATGDVIGSFVILAIGY
ncbi:Uncharacterised protein [Serratia fonticola]|uniref:gp53-like domain-containing protein n=1 Tax=Serratia fonticola TaxID=47917 RepID=UPI0021782EEB|nr:hypothetical protein [Serratia fonticola]CAI1698096.1 Uncharacterised protein [Serratia fonticola]